MKTILLFGADLDEELCKLDPLDSAQAPRRHYQEIPDNTDVLVLWREWGDEFEDGYRDHCFAQGIFESVTMGQVEVMIAAATDRLLSAEIE